jgi:hypothetical protein
LRNGTGNTPFFIISENSKDNGKMEKEEFKKRFPTLAKEIEEKVGKANLKLQGNKPQKERKFARYSPNVIDFIRRCSTHEKALEIIEFLKERGEITSEEAENYIVQLNREGLRSFGPKKKPGYYERES